MEMLYGRWIVMDLLYPGRLSVTSTSDKERPSHDQVTNKYEVTTKYTLGMADIKLGTAKRLSLPQHRVACTW